MSPKFCRRQVIRPGVVLLIFSAASSFAVSSISNAATVPPAPVIEKPLAPAISDAPGEPPSPQHMWIPGHWRWHEGAYVWETGRWDIPPAANVVWHAPEWQHQGNGYVLRDGYWAEPAPTAAAPATVVQAAPAPTSEIVVTAPPPPLQRESIPERPIATHVWIPGYWAWERGRHVWVPGYWIAPPRSNVVWVPARWETRGSHHAFRPGYWREAVVMAPAPAAPANVLVSAPPPMHPQQQQQQLIVVTAPPAPRREVVYMRPSPNHVWVPGYWTWASGRYVWIAGHYTVPPRGRHTWNEPRWERRGGNYVFFEGHWR